MRMDVASIRNGANKPASRDEVSKMLEIKSDLNVKRNDADRFQDALSRDQVAKVMARSRFMEACGARIPSFAR